MTTRTCTLIVFVAAFTSIMFAWATLITTVTAIAPDACVLRCASANISDNSPPSTSPQEAGDMTLETPGSVADFFPKELRIPAINVAALIIPAGVNAQGDMDTPRNVSDVSWYQWGAPPGELGSAVLAGHVDNAAGTRGVFKYLHTLRPGDEISVTRNDGTVQRFIVSEIATYPRSQVPRERLFNQKDAARLNLITCGGSWDAVQRTYTHRVVVYAIAASEIVTISANDGGLSRLYDVPARGR